MLEINTANSSSENWLSNDSIAVDSFVAHTPSPTYTHLEKMVELLIKMNKDKELQSKEQQDTYLSNLTELTAATLKVYKDPGFKRIVKSFGWTGNRYSNDDKFFDSVELLKSLSNLYLKGQMGTNQEFFVESFVENEGINYLEKIAAFCPDIVIDCLRNKAGVCLGSELNASSYSVVGACMLIDISNFSKYSASMCSQGMKGLDELRKATSGLLGMFVKSVYEHDGDVIAFAGDALVCLFPIKPKDDSQDFNRQSRDLSQVDPCFRALHCANLLRTVQYQELSTHIGISYGEMCLAFLGGHNGHWVYMLNGKCLSQLSACVDEAKAGSVVLTQRSHDHLLRVIDQAQQIGHSDEEPISHYLEFPEMSFQQLPSGNYLLSRMDNCATLTNLLNDVGRLESLSRSPSKQPSGKVPFTKQKSSRSVMSPRPPPPPRMSPNTPLSVNKTKNLRKGSSRSIRNISMENIYATITDTNDAMDAANPDRMLVDALVLFLPLPITLALHTEGNHQISELRQVTTLFMSLDSYDPVGHADPVRLQPMFVTAQQVLAETGGFLRQFLIDDKGCVLIAMWGVPSYTYANNCSRALYCASAIKSRISMLEHKCSMGITTGTVFCGTIGAAERSDYAGIGTEVNLAARLMSKAHGRILIDSSTYNNLNAANRALLIAGEELLLKGMPAPIIPFELPPTATPMLTTIDADPQYKKNKLLRKKIMHLLEKELDKVACRGASHVSPLHYRQTLIRAPRTKSTRIRGLINNNVHCIILCGPPGSGKNTAAEYFRRSARERAIQTINIKLQAMHRTIPFQLIRELFLELVGAENFITPDQQSEVLDNLVDGAYPNESAAVHRMARQSLETILGLHRSNSPNPNPDSFFYSDSPNRSVKSARSNRSPPRSPQLGLSPANSLSRGSPDEVLLSSYGVFKEQVGEHCRGKADFSFYKIISTMLRSTPTALIIEDAHCCDELSWNELMLMIVGGDFDMSVLLIMKTNPQHRLKSNSTGGDYSPVMHEDSHGSHHSRDHTPPYGSPSSHMTSPIRYTGVHGSLQQDDLGFLDDVVDNEDILATVGLDHLNFAAFRAIAKHPNTHIAEMKGLNEEEVRNLLLHTLNTETVSQMLVQLVMDVSSGSPYWCKVIAQFVQERGLSHLEAALETDKHHSAQHSLKTLVLCKMEQLSTAEQKVLKYASVLGLEFDIDILTAITPISTSGRFKKSPSSKKLSVSVLSALEQLEKHGFIHCISEHPVLMYAFQNDLIQRAIYELLLPSDAATIHCNCAAYIEGQYQDSLRPFYPMLAHHYQRGLERSKAFKYEIKSAALAVSSGAFNDGLMFATSAISLADNVIDMDVLVELTHHAIQHLQLQESPVARKKFSSSFCKFVIGESHFPFYDTDNAGGADSPSTSAYFSPTPSSNRSASLFASNLANLDSPDRMSKKTRESKFITETFLEGDHWCEMATAQSFRSLMERAEAVRKQMMFGQPALSSPQEARLLAAKSELLRSNTLQTLPSSTERMRRSTLSSSPSQQHNSMDKCCTIS